MKVEMQITYNQLLADLDKKLRYYKHTEKQKFVQGYEKAIIDLKVIIRQGINQAMGEYQNKTE